MAYNGSGVYNLVMDWVADAAAGIKIRADRHMTQDTDFKNALSNVVCRDGQSTITADMPWNAKRITNLGDPVNAGDALNKQWAQSNLVSGAYVADTPPAAAQAGNLWWDSDSGNLFLKFNDGTSTQWVQVNVAPPVAPPDYQPGVVKISSGEQTADFASLDIPLPSGFFAWELQFKGLAVNVSPTSPAMRFSWDNGATFPASAGEYNQLTWQASSGTSSTATASATSIIFVSSMNNNAAKRGHGRCWMPVDGATERATMQFYTDEYDSNAAHRLTHGYAYSLLQSGPPNVLRILVASNLMLAGFKWQLNGIR